MALFVSNGSNFTWRTAWSFLWARGTDADRQQLREYLQQTYGGKARLYYRGRGALAAAIRLTGASEVATTSFTCYAVEEAIKAAGAQPIFVDIKPKTFHFGINELRQAYKQHPGIKTVIIQNTFGLSWDIRPVEKFCKQHKLYLVEDLAHSVGMNYKDGRLAGTVGDLVMFSFGRDKHIDVVNGGALVVRRQQLAKKLQPELVAAAPRMQEIRERLYPRTSWKARVLYRFGVGKVVLKVGLATGLLNRSAAGGLMADYHLPAYKARLILQKLRRQPHDLVRRYELLAALGQEIPPGSSPLRYPILLTERQKFVQLAKKQGFYLADIWYNSPVYPQRYQRRSSYAGNCPRAEQAASQIINLPLHINTRPAHMLALRKLLEECQEAT